MAGVLQPDGLPLPVATSARPVPTLDEPTRPFIRSVERGRLHHMRMPYTSAIAGGAMVRLSKSGVPKVKNPNTGKWINVGGKTYNKLFREGKVQPPLTESASRPARLEDASPIREGYAIETDATSVLPLPHIHVDHTESEAKKEEVKFENDSRDELNEQNIIHSMANQAVQIDSEKMRIVLQLAGITSSTEQDRIIGEVQRRNSGLGEYVDKMSQSNREAEALARLPKTAISPETVLPLMGEMNTNGQFVPRVGPYLVENIKDQERIPKNVIILRKPSVIAKLQGVLESGKNINNKIEANHELAQLSFVEKTMYNVNQQGADIQKYDPPTMQWFQMVDGNTGNF